MATATVTTKLKTNKLLATFENHLYFFTFFRTSCHKNFTELKYQQSGTKAVEKLPKKDEFR